MEVAQRQRGFNWALLMTQQVKNRPAVQETEEIWIRSVCGEDPLEKEMATHSSILAWRIPRTEEPSRLQSNGSQRIGHNQAAKKGNAKECSNYSTIALISHASRRRQWHPTPVLLPRKSHGWKSLEGCSPWGREELDTTERLHLHFSLSCIGEGNGNPLQCSCLENPTDGGAWWAAIYGVAQSRTRLK